MTPSEALNEAIRVAKGQKALAAMIGKSQGHVATWKRRGRCAADMAISIERATGVPRQELRPDLYPRAEAA